MWKYLHNFLCQAHNFNRPWTCWGTTAPMTRTLLSGPWCLTRSWTVGHVPTFSFYHFIFVLILHVYVLYVLPTNQLTNPDFAPTEKPTKKAKTAMLFAALSEDQRGNANRTMPANVTLEGYSWKCSTRVHSQKDDGWTAYYSCCHKADWERCEASLSPFPISFVIATVVGSPAIVLLGVHPGAALPFSSG